MFLATVVLAAMLPAAPVFVVPQTAPVNPEEIAFVCADHAIDTDHEVGFFLRGAATPVTMIKLGDPALVAGEVHLTIDTRPLALGDYDIKVRVYAGAAVGAWSAALPFVRALSQPVNLRIVR